MEPKPLLPDGAPDSPYFDDGLTRLWHADILDMLDRLDPDDFSVLVSDVPYGIGYRSNAMRGPTLARSIAGDEDTALRDTVLEWWGDRPALIFGTWRIPRPVGTRQVLIWDTKGALGMGAMDLPWKPAHQEIYVLGKGFRGRRDSDVLVCPPVQAMAQNGRVHPHEKPVSLMRMLLDKCPPGAVLDPFAGSGATLRAAADLGRPATGVEVDGRYLPVAADRLAQQTLPLAGVQLAPATQEGLALG